MVVRSRTYYPNKTIKHDKQNWIMISLGCVYMTVFSWDKCRYNKRKKSWKESHFERYWKGVDKLPNWGITPLLRFPDLVMARWHSCGSVVKRRLQNEFGSVGIASPPSAPNTDTRSGFPGKRTGSWDAVSAGNRRWWSASSARGAFDLDVEMWLLGLAFLICEAL